MEPDITEIQAIQITPKREKTHGIKVSEQELQYIKDLRDIDIDIPETFRRMVTMLHGRHCNTGYTEVKPEVSYTEVKPEVSYTEVKPEETTTISKKPYKKPKTVTPELTPEIRSRLKECEDMLDTIHGNHGLKITTNGDREHIVKHNGTKLKIWVVDHMDDDLHAQTVEKGIYPIYLGGEYPSDFQMDSTYIKEYFGIVE